MLHTDDRFAEAVEAAVTRLEAATDAEIVVVAVPRSHDCRDLSLLFGVGLAWSGLWAMLLSPWPFEPWLMPLELLGVGAFGAWLAHRKPGLLRLFLSPARSRRQVEEAADAAFHQELVHGTRGRTGLLVYFSALEQRVALRPDLGLDARVPRAEWNAIAWGPGQDPRRCTRMEDLLAGLDKVGAVLAARVPPLSDNPDEIANAPRVRT